MHVRKHGNGYRAVVTYKGRQRSVVGATEAEANFKGAQLLIEMGGTIKASDVDVAQLLQIWLAATEAEHKPTYHVDVTRVIDRLPAAFTSRPVALVDPLVIVNLHRQLAKAGWSAHRIHRAHRALATAWKDVAIPYGWAHLNPAALISPPTPAKTAVTAPDAASVQKLLAATSGRVRLFLELAARTGARRGELCALQWIDIGEKQLVIRRSIADVPGRRGLIGDTKTGAKGRRVLAIDDLCAELLRAEHERQTIGASASTMPAPVWLFSDDCGFTPWRTDYISRVFRHLCITCGIEGVRLHSLRHFGASEMLAAGIPLSTVAGRLGHAQVATTRDRYGSLVKAADQEAAAVMGRVLDAQS